MAKLGTHPSKKTREKMRKARQVRVVIDKRKACARGEHEFAMAYNHGENCLNCGFRGGDNCAIGCERDTDAPTPATSRNT